MAPLKPVSEVRTYRLIEELVAVQGWTSKTSGARLLPQQEYRNIQALKIALANASKTGAGMGFPEYVLLRAQDEQPLAVFEGKARISQIAEAIRDATHYADALYDAGFQPLAVAVAGTNDTQFEIRILKRKGTRWYPITYENEPISWIPGPEEITNILKTAGNVELRPRVPPPEILKEKAEEINGLLRESGLKDDFRPGVIGAIMLALWKDGTSIRRDPRHILGDLNKACEAAFQNAMKPELSKSIRVDEANNKLAIRAPRICQILERLNITTLTAEHDYIGALYEEFFRYTGGNTIGQYFTPRHIALFMANLCAVTKNDVTIDITCGTGGFLISAMQRMQKTSHLSRAQISKIVKTKLIGIETEPVTAALCVVNMILRGDGTTGIRLADAFDDTNFPFDTADIVMMNPPFPHKKTDTPPDKYLDRALLSLHKRGILASIVPYSLLVNVGDWHRHILKENKLLFVATLPPDLFNPYATFNTAIIMLQKGVPHDDSSVLFARLWNDGYKLKKNNRIPQTGSQIPEIEEAYDRKTSKEELTAFKSVNVHNKEWSPEAFIEGAEHNDDEFIRGLERHVRSHAAFYISEGHRLLPSSNSVGTTAVPKAFAKESTLSLKGVTMGTFNLSDYFDIKLGGKDEIEDLADDGDTPIVSTSEFNNGVTAWKRPPFTYPSPAITVATDGSTCSSFVQEFPFYAFYKVAILRPKQENFPIDAMYYIAYLLKRERWRYVYARKFGKARLASTNLYGPSKDGKPDFKKMAQLVRSTAAFPIVQSFRKAHED